MKLTRTGYGPSCVVFKMFYFIDIPIRCTRPKGNGTVEEFAKEKKLMTFSKLLVSKRRFTLLFMRSSKFNVAAICISRSFAEGTGRNSFLRNKVTCKSTSLQAHFAEFDGCAN